MTARNTNRRILWFLIFYVLRIPHREFSLYAFKHFFFLSHSAQVFSFNKKTNVLLKTSVFSLKHKLRVANTYLSPFRSNFIEISGDRIPRGEVKGEGHTFLRERNSAFLCAPRMADMWCCVRNRLSRFVTISRRTILLFLSPAPVPFLLPVEQAGVYRIRDATPPGPGSRDIAEIDPWTRAERADFCNVFIFFLPSRISDNSSGRTEVCRKFII